MLCFLDWWKYWVYFRINRLCYSLVVQIHKMKYKKKDKKIYIDTGNGFAIIMVSLSKSRCSQTKTEDKYILQTFSYHYMNAT